MTEDKHGETSGELLGAAKRVAEAGDRWFLSLARALGQGAGRLRHETDIVAGSAKRAAATTGRVTIKILQQMKAKAPQASRADATPAQEGTGTAEPLFGVVAKLYSLDEGRLAANDDARELVELLHLQCLRMQAEKAEQSSPSGIADPGPTPGAVAGEPPVPSSSVPDEALAFSTSWRDAAASLVSAPQMAESIEPDAMELGGHAGEAPSAEMPAGETGESHVRTPMAAEDASGLSISSSEEAVSGPPVRMPAEPEAAELGEQAGEVPSEVPAAEASPDTSPTRASRQERDGDGGGKPGRKRRGGGN